ncbi:hypothetical protein CCACVL1_03428 [Corchorus capsularis]|uniref:Uncharacterized protein n=1 Tax=Corchorus capsularis TaxID=210143 RepID=A0A1R3JZK5_COCAP|nr:hypothetical protein CCACVL1_03428 [Corchorus capsularis]
MDHRLSKLKKWELERGLHGLEPVVVANFPTKKFSDECFSAAEDAHNE